MTIFAHHWRHLSFSVMSFLFVLLAFIGIGEVNAQNTFTFNGRTYNKIFTAPNSDIIVGFDVSPDGTQIVLSLRASEGRLYMMNADGTRLHPIAFMSHQEAYDPQWSPDGKSILFRGRSEAGWDLFIADIESKKIRQLTDNRTTSGFWSPDGEQILLASANTISLIDADGSNEKVLLTGYYPTWMDWSPDGEQIVFDEINDGGFSTIYLMNADGSDVTPLTEPMGINFNPVWSPEGNYLVFIASDSSDPWKLFWMLPDGSQKTVLLADGEFKQDLTWSDDENYVFFQDGEHTLLRLEMSVDDNPATSPTALPPEPQGH